MASKPAAASKSEGQRSGDGDNTLAAATRKQKEQQPALKCPRCDSSNTKFCYYNNYNLSQPRHFCKTCRRYWTKGGALRNVPIGGGCRKNKKVTKSYSAAAYSNLSGDSSSPSDIMDGLRILEGLSPTLDFQLGGINFPSLNSSTAGHFNQLSAASSVTMAPSSLDLPSGSATSLLDFNFSFNSGNGGVQEMTNNLASTIESFSSINQDWNWKLQQQRLGISSSAPPLEFQNLDILKPDETFGRNNSRNADEATDDWFFGNNSNTSSVSPTEGKFIRYYRDTINGNGNAGNWNHVQAWSNFNALP